MKSIIIDTTCLISMSGVIYISDVDMRILLSLWPAKIPDYGDAVLASLCRQTKESQIATFAKKFIQVLAEIKLPAWKF